MILTVLATLATTLTGQPCAVIDNRHNMAAFAVPGHATVTRSYTDYSDNLGYSGRVPRAAWPAENAAVQALQIGKAGPKLRMACTR